MDLSETNVWPTVPKLIPEARNDGARWRLNSGETLIDGHTDTGGFPISNEILGRWIADGIAAGHEVRKPHVYFDSLRDRDYPRTLAEHLGPGWKQDISVFYSNSGSEAIEAAMKLARKATGRTQVHGILGDFHGRTYGAMSLHNSPYEEQLKTATFFSPDYPRHHFDGFGPFVSDASAVTHSSPHSTHIAALVISPIQSNNTLEDVPRWVWEYAAQVRGAGGLIIFDEVQTGFGRAGGVVSVTTANWWYLHAEQMANGDPAIADVMLHPDIHVFGKAAGAGWPFSLTVARKSLANVMPLSGHFNTMSGSPLGCYLSARLIDELYDGLGEQMLTRARKIQRRFAPFIIRRGYMMAIETDDPFALGARAREAGLLLMPVRPDKPVRFSLPFIMTPQEEYALFAALEKTLK